MSPVYPRLTGYLLDLGEESDRSGTERQDVGSDEERLYSVGAVNEGPWTTGSARLPLYRSLLGVLGEDTRGQIRPPTRVFETLV